MTGPHADQLWDGRYKLVRRLGAGGMASVWLARDERLDRDVALKLISDVLVGDREYIARFEREARVAAGLNHPNLVTVFDASVADGRPYLVMEVISGGAAAARELTFVEVEHLAEEMLAALGHIHEAGVVHRDLKPANVLIDDHGHFRLTDFGIAQPGDATSLTQTGKLIGTMKYMAPEVRAGQRATVRSDLYSLGVLLRECGAESVPSLARLLKSLAHEEPAARPGSAREAAALMREPTTPTRTLAQSLSHRRPVTLAAAAVVAAAAVAIVLAVASGGGDDGDKGDSQLSTTTERPETQTDSPAPAPQPPAETEPEQEPAPQPSVPTCEELEAQKKALEEEKKAAEEGAGDDKEAKEAIKSDFEEQRKALEEQKKDCVK